MAQRKTNARVTQVSNIIELSSHLRRIVLSGDSLNGFPTGQEGAHVKVVLPSEQQTNSADKNQKMRSYTIRSFNQDTLELTLDFVINRHKGPATDWAKNAKLGDQLAIAGPGPLKITDYNQSSYLLVGDITSVNAINGFVPKFTQDADIQAVISVPTRSDIITMDYDDSANTYWFIEDEMSISLEQQVLALAKNMAKDTCVFLALEASKIRSLRPMLEEQLELNRLNCTAVGYWKQGVDADKFGAQKKSEPF
ncbi:siderophore-interacting protein [Psychrosphaera saromensis]|uniref:NADPH-dependent ferric siderophore reductase n=1 Tax=Psychrosphaera saromensis TaxID=716813 RepID=A0A2S7USN0_9GAMM|nr:siderophore-interacting protein [Psychrosphaera saromensis]PQJ52280.1 NADPH-dependent ferric siderophore reductase [Psychrosphaera saromensis]GHB72443.1 siderophore-interacting protein [Psychrosphaera saromensis]GLQ13569.1 siderophore-interacting protein [Psychrosphaera saromensis]